jgi:adenine-specific DNA methylase
VVISGVNSQAKIEERKHGLFFIFGNYLEVSSTSTEVIGNSLKAASKKRLEQFTRARHANLNKIQDVLAIPSMPTRRGFASSTFAFPRQLKTGEQAMSNSLEVRRQKVIRQLERVNSKITATEKRLALIQTRLVVLDQRRPKAA